VAQAVKCEALSSSPSIAKKEENIYKRQVKGMDLYYFPRMASRVSFIVFLLPRQGNIL
jgi:hypothetical protein